MGMVGSRLRKKRSVDDIESLIQCNYIFSIEISIEIIQYSIVILFAF